jgi:ABC-type multidrug transport system ATPase subunit
VPYGFENFGDFGNYVMQQDILLQTMTVRETLRFAADLKLNAGDAAKEEAIR